MTFQVLLSMMNKNDNSFIEKMNIHSDLLVINQSDENELENFKYNNYEIKIFSFAEKGVGLSRNNALMRTNADIALVADDDCVYVNNYKNLIIDSFKKYPMADVIFFNMISKNQKRVEKLTGKAYRVRWYNCLKFGAFRMAIKVQKIRKMNINFSLLFGGGARYSCGEDTLFIVECLKKGLKLYAVPVEIGTVEQKESTWFKGYTEKYFFDKGALFAAISKQWAWLLCLQFLFRYRHFYKKLGSFFYVFKLMTRGGKDFNKL
ncbi:hypothetical protein [Anaerosinus gibii]|uniref:Glycosyltransferase 2-like domain-containing protein n=1 Tax=Selenobaculum gibii TaxID=3054208 RepID=A0A9Y2AHU5_9FIRM|nr:hypothetical protein [Selenobaculum gbiensis]WIW71094.1 hypothetical protein P3F81_01845 [Selenobaculum gbiensis]